ncbi:MAG TPA: ABC transporter permease [Trueperaceae bacterium]
MNTGIAGAITETPDEAAPGLRSGKALRRFLANPLSVAGACYLLLLIAVALLAPFLTPYDPITTDPINAFAPPSSEHWLGTDEVGRDVLTRLIFGARTSLAVGFLVMVLGVVTGTILGSLSGYYRGWVDSVIMRFTDAVMAIPLFFLLLSVLALFGTSPQAVIVVLGLTSWMGVARVVRSEFIRWREATFVEAASALGARARRIMLIHVLPQAIPSIIVAATLAVGIAILNESALSFLGLGIQPPQPTWGNMLMNSQQYIWTSPQLALYPGIVILLSVLSFNFVGDGLRDALDPTSR